jgi:hypothetical protein
MNSSKDCAAGMNFCLGIGQREMLTANESSEVRYRVE